MRFLLDTSTCIRHLRGTSQTISDRLDQAGADAALCSIVVHELMYGTFLSRNPATELVKVERFCGAYISLPVDERVAAEAARVRAFLSNAGTPIGPYDLLIASTARVHKMSIVTCNGGEFSRVPGLEVVDWQRI